jgi:hypothetical protein
LLAHTLNVFVSIAFTNINRFILQHVLTYSFSYSARFSNEMTCWHSTRAGTILHDI